jgi:hypothetical protein
LAAAGRKMTRCAGVARHEGYKRKRQNKDDVAPRRPKGRTFGRRRWKYPERNNVIRNPGTKRQLRLKFEETSEEFDRKALDLEFVKRATGMSSRLRKIRN